METSGMPDIFDLTMGNLRDLPDVTTSGHYTRTTTVPIVGHQQTFHVQTLRQSGRGDTIFIETMGKEGAFRFVLFPDVADAIARQRETLKTTVARKHGKRLAAERKARGEVPGFLRGRTDVAMVGQNVKPTEATKRHMSAAARKRISDAQKRRWARARK